MQSIVSVCTELRVKFPELLKPCGANAINVLTETDGRTEEQRTAGLVLSALLEVMRSEDYEKVQHDRRIFAKITSAINLALPAFTFSRLVVLALARIRDDWKHITVTNKVLTCMVGPAPNWMNDHRLKITLYDNVMVCGYPTKSRSVRDHVDIVHEAALYSDNELFLESEWVNPTPTELAAGDDASMLFSQIIDRMFEHEIKYWEDYYADDEEEEYKHPQTAKTFLVKLLEVGWFDKDTRGGGAATAFTDMCVQ